MKYMYVHFYPLFIPLPSYPCARLFTSAQLYILKTLLICHMLLVLLLSRGSNMSTQLKSWYNLTLFTRNLCMILINLDIDKLALERTRFVYIVISWIIVNRLMTPFRKSFWIDYENSYTNNLLNYILKIILIIASVNIKTSEWTITLPSRCTCISGVVSTYCAFRPLEIP